MCCAKNDSILIVPCNTTPTHTHTRGQQQPTTVCVYTRCISLFCDAIHLSRPVGKRDHPFSPGPCLVNILKNSENFMPFLVFLFSCSGSSCQLPDAWRGTWFQSGLNTVRINETAIDFKGKCLESDGEYYLFEEKYVQPRITSSPSLSSVALLQAVSS